jgi:methionyl-tRNA formyltransferase
MKKIKVVFFGSPQFVVPILETLKERFELVGVVSNPDQKVGRKQILTPTPVKIAAQNLQIPVFTPEKPDQSLSANLHTLNPDLFVVAAYGKIIPQEVIDIPKYGSLNVHPSLLPAYRGATPIQTAILNGDQISGLTIYKMDEKMDHGPIVFQEQIKLTDKDNNESLSNKLFSLSAQLLIQIIPDFVNGNLQVQAQDDEKATFCKTLSKQSGYFDILQPPSLDQLDRTTRAYFPWPTAWTTWNNKVVKFYPDQKIQMEGKNIVNMKEFLNGYPNFPLKIS